MTPQQKRAIVVMIESIEHQLTAVKALLCEVGDHAQAAGGHKVINQATFDEGGYLSDQEEDELAKAIEVTPAEKTALLQSMMNRYTPTPEGPQDVPGSNQG